MDRVSELRVLKNKIIGNPEAKDSLAEDASLARVLQCLGQDYDVATQIEAANVLYSLSSGSQEALLQLLKSKTCVYLLESIQKLDSHSPSKLKVALGRALRTLICSLADCAGPQLWSLLPTVSPDLRKEVQVALDEFFDSPALDVWLPFATDSHLHPLLCATIAGGARISAHRYALCEWLPPAERAKASKGKRGWEKPVTSIASPTVATFSQPLSAIPSPGWILRQLSDVIVRPGSISSKIIVSLEALAALCRDNPPACSIVRSELAHQVPPAGNLGQTEQNAGPLIAMQRSMNPEVRIAVNYLLANMIRATTMHPTLSISSPNGILQPHIRPFSTAIPVSATCLTVIHNLILMIESNVEPEAIRAKACYVVSRLIMDDLDITEAAVDSGVIPALFVALKWSAKSSPDRQPSDDPEDEDVDEHMSEESQTELQLREAALTLMATIGLTNNKYSEIILRLDAPLDRANLPSLIGPASSSSNVESHHGLLFPLLSRSISSQNHGVQHSALQVVRALSRALATLRTSLLDSDIPTKVIGIITSSLNLSSSAPVSDSVTEDIPTKHRAVTITALMVMCNFLNDYAPFRESILKKGVAKHLVQGTRSTDVEIRLNAMWALRNAAFNAKGSEIITIMEALSWDHYLRLADDPDSRIREQTIILLQNITTTSQDVLWVVDSLGVTRLVKLLQDTLAREDPATVEHGVKVLNNIVTEPPREILMSNKAILTLLKANLSHSSVHVRHASVFCVCELLSRYPFRHRELREIGIEQALRAIVGGRDRLGHGPALSTGSGFGAALGSAGPFGSNHGQAASNSPIAATSRQLQSLGGGASDTPGLMGRESDREVLDAVKVALALLEKGKE